MVCCVIDRHHCLEGTWYPPSGGKQVLWLAEEYDFDHSSGFTWDMPTVKIFMTSIQCIPVLAEVQVPYACELILFSVVLLVQHVHNFTLTPNKWWPVESDVCGDGGLHCCQDLYVFSAKLVGTLSTQSRSKSFSRSWIQQLPKQCSCGFVISA